MICLPLTESSYTKTGSMTFPDGCFGENTAMEVASPPSLSSRQRVRFLLPCILKKGTRLSFQELLRQFPVLFYAVIQALLDFLPILPTHSLAGLACFHDAVSLNLILVKVDFGAASSCDAALFANPTASSLLAFMKAVSEAIYCLFPRCYHLCSTNYTSPLFACTIRFDNESTVSHSGDVRFGTGI